MAMRDFRDSAGVHWVVWSTIPWAASLLADATGGWLTFVSPTSRRRVMPIPEGWEDASPERLEMMCRGGVEIVTPVAGAPAIHPRHDDRRNGR
jgi:hypothetical protein